MQERGSYLACCVYILGQSIGKCSISDPQPLLGSGIYADLMEAPLRLQYWILSVGPLLFKKKFEHLRLGSKR